MLSQQQLKARRREKVLSRAAQLAGEQNQQTWAQVKPQQNPGSDVFQRYRLLQKKQANRKLYMTCSKLIGAAIAIFVWLAGQIIVHLSQICFFASIVIIWMLMKLNQSNAASTIQKEAGFQNNAMFTKVQQVNNILGINRYLKIGLNMYAVFVVTSVIITSLQNMVGINFIETSELSIESQNN